jgi:hypothetical protein
LFELTLYITADTVCPCTFAHMMSDTSGPLFTNLHVTAVSNSILINSQYLKPLPVSVQCERHLGLNDEVTNRLFVNKMAI